MKYFINYSVLFVAVLCIFSCLKHPLRVENSSNPNLKVELLLEHDDCKIYRFMDSNWVYFTKCGETSNLVSCGKNCTRLQRNLK